MQKIPAVCCCMLVILSSSSVSLIWSSTPASGEQISMVEPVLFRDSSSRETLESASSVNETEKLLDALDEEDVQEILRELSSDQVATVFENEDMGEI